MPIHYDDSAVNEGIILDYPLREGTGALYTRDVAKPHHPITMVSAPAWTIIASGLNVLTLDGALDYLWTPAADTLDLDFTDEDYSLGMWVKFASGGPDNATPMSRFLLNNHGWELYLWGGTLTLRHHHAGTLVPPVTGNGRSSSYSTGWAFGEWYLMGVSRAGAAGAFFRGDATSLVALTTIGTLVDPETSNGNFFIGNNHTGANLLKGSFWRPRIWLDRALTLADWQQIYEQEKHWFA